MLTAKKKEVYRKLYEVKRGNKKTKQERIEELDGVINMGKVPYYSLDGDPAFESWRIWAILEASDLEEAKYIAYQFTDIEGSRASRPGAFFSRKARFIPIGTDRYAVIQDQGYDV